jgi:hypothetical protein
MGEERILAKGGDADPFSLVGSQRQTRPERAVPSETINMYLEEEE